MQILRLSSYIFSAFVVSLPMTSHAQRVISPAYPGRYLPITQVEYMINNSPVVQTTEASSPTTQSQAVNVTKVTVQGGRSLDIFNFAGARVRDINGEYGKSNIQTAQTGIGTVNHTGLTPVSAGKAAFDNALVQTTQNNNILDYIYYDGSNTTPAASFDYDLLFYRAYELTDAFLIQERDGNTYFGVVPLGADGNPILGSNTLIFGGNTDAVPESSGSSQTRYDWNTGYALSNYQSSQSVAFTVIESSAFFAGTSVAPLDQIVYGFRVDNNGNADVKFFGLSDDSFENNPLNPLIPEPSTLMSGLAGIILIMRRRR